MPFPTYTRTLTADGWDLDVDTLSKEIAAAVPGKEFAVNANGPDVEVSDSGAFTAAEQATCDTVISDHIAAFDPLPAAQAAKIAAINKRTEELIQAGFQHAGKQFSLSTNAQIKWMGASTLAAFFTAVGAYPLTVNTKDDLDTYAVVDEADLIAIWQTVGTSVLTILSGDTALKTAARDATTVAEVDAVLDER